MKKKQVPHKGLEFSYPSLEVQTMYMDRNTPLELLSDLSDVSSDSDDALEDGSDDSDVDHDRGVEEDNDEEWMNHREGLTEDPLRELVKE